MVRRFWSSPRQKLSKIKMSLLPRIPCRKLWIDSRYALPGGNSCEFEIEIPQGGLDLPDNCVGFVDSISVPSFPNVFEGRDNCYVRESTRDVIKFRVVKADSDNYKPSLFAQHLKGKLNSGSILVDTQHVTTNSQTYTGSDVEYSEILFTLQASNGSGSYESSMVLTDDDLRTLTDRSPVWDISGQSGGYSGFWSYPRVIPDEDV